MVGIVSRPFTDDAREPGANVFAAGMNPAAIATSSAFLRSLR